jgi:acylphosphatase
MARIAKSVRVTGRVQGVFFRAWTAEQATKLGVSGWVRNASDGSVEAHFEGEKWSVLQLIDLLRQGPPSAKVAQVTVDAAESTRADHFEVRH